MNFWLEIISIKILVQVLIVIDTPISMWTWSLFHQRTFLTGHTVTPPIVNLIEGVKTFYGQTLCQKPESNKLTQKLII